MWKLRGAKFGVSHAGMVADVDRRRRPHETHSYIRTIVRTRHLGRSFCAICGEHPGPFRYRAYGLAMATAGSTPRRDDAEIGIGRRWQRTHDQENAMAGERRFPDQRKAVIRLSGTVLALAFAQILVTGSLAASFTPLGGLPGGNVSSMARRVRRRHRRGRRQPLQRRRGGVRLDRAGRHGRTGGPANPAADVEVGISDGGGPGCRPGGGGTVLLTAPSGSQRPLP